MHTINKSNKNFTLSNKSEKGGYMHFDLTQKVQSMVFNWGRCVMNAEQVDIYNKGFNALANETTTW